MYQIKTVKRSVGVKITPSTPRATSGTKPYVLRSVHQNPLEQQFPSASGGQIGLIQAQALGWLAQILHLQGQFAGWTAEYFHQANLLVVDLELLLLNVGKFIFKLNDQLLKFLMILLW